MYRLVIHQEVADQLDALPAHLLGDYADAVDDVMAAPWAGSSHNLDKPDAEVRRRLFGPLGVGQVIYLVLEREQEVHLIEVIWLELPDG